MALQHRVGDEPCTPETHPVLAAELGNLVDEWGWPCLLRALREKATADSEGYASGEDACEEYHVALRRLGGRLEQAAALDLP